MHNRRRQRVITHHICNQGDSISRARNGAQSEFSPTHIQSIHPPKSDLHREFRSAKSEFSKFRFPVGRIGRFRDRLFVQHPTQPRAKYANEITSDDPIFLDDVTVDDARTREKPMAEIFLIETRRQIELVQILEMK